MEMEQLLSMGFSGELAAQALAATGGDSTVKATEWILSQSNSQSSQTLIQNQNPKPPNQNSPNSQQSQQKLNRFFPFHSKPTKISPLQPDPDDPSSPKRLKRPSNLVIGSRNVEEVVAKDHVLRPNSRDGVEVVGKGQILGPSLGIGSRDSVEVVGKDQSLRPNSNVIGKDQNLRSDSVIGSRNVVEVVGKDQILRPKSVFGSAGMKNSNGLRSVVVSEPLAERMRPRDIGEVVGQDHILGPNSLIGSAIKCNRLPSIVLWGPPGTGKTSIAKAIAKSGSMSYRFVTLSAVTSGVKDVRDAVEEARKVRGTKGGKRTVLFVDEVHRFNKSQQDSFLPVIEDGSIVFIGATTENPSFHLVTPLLSRCRVLTLNPLQPCDVAGLLKRAVDDSEKGLSKSVGMRVEVEDGAIELLSSHCDGDARVALNALEVCATTAAARIRGTGQSSKVDGDLEGIGEEGKVLSDEGLSVIVNVDDAKEALQCKHLAYDRAGEEHYNLISALHKSMRGSDANASIYWLARMLEGGEQPLYIARRLVRFASEDVGLADPNAITQAVACYQACHFIGMPECNVNLAQCVAYLALAPKSVAVYQAMKDALKVVKDSVGGNEAVPLHLRNAPTKLMKDLGYGKEYIYTPDNPSAPQSFLPPSLLGHKFLDWPRRDAL